MSSTSLSEYTSIDKLTAINQLQTLCQKMIEGPLKQLKQFSSVKMEKMSSSETFDSETTSQKCFEEDPIICIRENVIGINSKILSCFQMTLNQILTSSSAHHFSPIQNSIAHAQNMALIKKDYIQKMTNYSRKSLLSLFNASLNIYDVILDLRSQNILQNIIRHKSDRECTLITDQRYHFSQKILALTETCTQYNFRRLDFYYQIESLEQKISNCKTENVIVALSVSNSQTSCFLDITNLCKIISTMKKNKKIVLFLDFHDYCSQRELNLSRLTEIDFAYINPRQNLGGNQSSSILIYKKKLKSNENSYFKDAFTLYRVALSFELVQRIGYTLIKERQIRNLQNFIQIIERHNEKLGHSNYIRVLNPQTNFQRSHTVRFSLYQYTQSVNQKLILRALEDIFGIYGVKLLDGMNSKHYFDRIKCCEVELPYLLINDQIQYLARSVCEIAENIQSIGLFYNLCCNGQVEALGILTKQIDYKFEFNDSCLLNSDNNNQKIEKLTAKIDLHAQFLKGKYILTNPIDCLRRIKHKRAGHQQF